MNEEGRLGAPARAAQDHLVKHNDVHQTNPIHPNLKALLHTVHELPAIDLIPTRVLPKSVCSISDSGCTIAQNQLSDAAAPTPVWK
jgi:hypothetical protein